MAKGICDENELQLAFKLSLSGDRAKFVEVFSHFSTTTHHVLEMPLYFETLRQWANKPQKSLKERLAAGTEICECILAPSQ